MRSQKGNTMTDATQRVTAAKAAIRAMKPEARAAFMKMVENGETEKAQQVVHAYAVEGINRQIRIASLCLESSRVMDGLTEVVYDKITA